MDFYKEIESFNNKYSFEEITLSKGKFRYLITGQGHKDTIVFLNGGTNSADMWFKYVDDLSADYQILLFDYSEDYKTYQELITGMNELFNSLNIVKPYLIGASLGGLTAQIYAQKYTDQVSGLMLLSTAAMSKSTLSQLKIKKPFGKFLYWYLKRCNYDKLKIKMINSVVKMTKKESDETQKYTKDMMEYVFKDYTKEKDLHVTSLMLDLFNQTPVTSETFKSLKGKILLILPKKDYFSSKQQSDLIEIMNNPKIVFVDGCHIATVLNVNLYLKEIRDFLQEI